MMSKKLVLTITHLLFAAGGFALGIYALPILMAPEAPSSEKVVELQSQSIYRGDFRRDLADSDFLHWGEGKVAVGNDSITLMGSIAPGPDYRLYLSPEFVETEANFVKLKSTMVQVGPVKTFENFVVSVPAGVDISSYNTVIIWCEAFGQFITAAQYR
ncbi:MAG: DM13 domain-containing protein [Halioglobus sp.]